MDLWETASGSTGRITPTIHESTNPIGSWWPARVTRPVLRIKSPLHHFNACRPKLVLVAGFAPALATLSTSCLFWLGYTSEHTSGWSLPPTSLVSHKRLY